MQTQYPNSTYWTPEICKMSPRTLHSINITLRVGFEKRSRCAAEFLPSQQLIHMTDARPPAAHHKTKWPSPNEILPRVRTYSGRSDWTVCLCRRDNSSASLNCSWRPRCVCFQRNSSPKLIFNVSLPLLNNEKQQWSCEWKIRQQQTVRVTCFQLHTYYHLRHHKATSS